MSAEAGRRGRRRALALAAAIVLPPVLVRGCLLDSYAIESDSMAPAFHGAEQGGDHLVVLRWAADWRGPERWDAVVLEGSVDPELPKDMGAMLKRVVGLPGEYVRLSGGDVYAGPEPEPPLARKPDELVAALLVPVHEAAGLAAPWTWTGPGEREPLDGGGTRLTAGAVGGTAVFDRLVDDGLPGEEGGEAVSDTAVALVLGRCDGVLEIVLREGADVFRARLPASGREAATLHHNLSGEVVASADEFAGLAPGQRLLVWNVDNGVRVRLDGETLLAWDYERNAAQPPGGPWHNEPALTVQAGGVELRSVAVLRDLHYTAQGVFGVAAQAPYHVGPGLIYVLGDHSRRSRDSRYFGPVPLDALRGRPIAIYRPWERATWLGRAATGAGRHD